jgi:hypothetical protein
VNVGSGTASVVLLLIAQSTRPGLPNNRGSVPSRDKYLRFEIFTAVTIKNGVFCDITPCGSYKNRRFGGT